MQFKMKYGINFRLGRNAVRPQGLVPIAKDRVPPVENPHEKFVDPKAKRSKHRNLTRKDLASQSTKNAAQALARRMARNHNEME
jgi:hypothetical protein